MRGEKDTASKRYEGLGVMQEDVQSETHWVSREPVLVTKPGCNVREEGTQNRFLCAYGTVSIREAGSHIQRGDADWSWVDKG